jgi:hypothetical protein
MSDDGPLKPGITALAGGLGADCPSWGSGRCTPLFLMLFQLLKTIFLLKLEIKQDFSYKSE